MTPDLVKIAIIAADDTVLIMAFVTDDKHGVTNEPTIENIQAEINKMQVQLDAVKLPLKSWEVIDHEDIPTDRTYRNAWHRPNGKIETHMGKARELHKDLLRELRAPKLAALDIEYQRADENGDNAKKAAIALQKKALRDITSDPRIAAATNPEQLKLITV